MDEKPFLHLDDKKSDILFVWDYSDLGFFPEKKDKIALDFDAYKNIYLIAFSYGVWASSFIKLPQLKKSVAVAGTGYVIDDKYGITQKVFDLMLDSISPQVMEKFGQRMFLNINDWDKYKRIKPERDFYDVKRELEEIKKNASKVFSQRKFDSAILCEKDKIFPFSSQKNYFKNTPQTIINTGHFPFFEFKSFSEILSI